MPPVSPCPDCDALIPDIAGPTHAYVSAPAGCWQVFNEVLAKDYSDREYWKVHRYMLDSYLAQHATGDDPRQVQSVNVHLFALFLTLEIGLPTEAVSREIHALVRKNKGKFQKLEKPSFKGTLNITNIAQAPDAAAHQQLVRVWAEQVWEKWRPVHGLIRTLR